jgi:LacI family transcriptional regulator
MDIDNNISHASDGSRKLKVIGLLLDTRGSYAAAVMHGIRRFADLAGDWQCITMEHVPAVVPVLRRQPPDGILATFFHADFARSIARLRIPTVEVSDWFPKSPFPRVVSGNEGVGLLAAEYFLDQGLRSLGFVGPMQLPWAKDRYAGYSRRLESAGIQAIRFDPTDFPTAGWATISWASPSPELRAWVKGLKKPAGVFGANDQFACSVLNAAQMEGVHVPEELAVLGVDNDVLMCGLARPPLSSIAVQDERIGFEAARLLDQLLAGVAPQTRTLRIPGYEVVVRQSSDILAIADKDVAAAVRFIRENASKKIDVGDVLARVPMPRRTLERRFRAALGRGPKQEIDRVRIEFAQSLLRSTDLPIRNIARRAGFTSPVHLSRAFRASQSTTPRAYRQQFQLGG